MDAKEYEKFLTDRFRVLPAAQKESVRNHISMALKDFRHWLPHKEVKILDAGCHEGLGLKILKRWGFNNVEGIDFVSPLVRAAKRKGCKAQQADLHALPYDKEIFDAVFSRYVLEHCHTPIQVMQEIFRTLKVGGFAYMIISLDPDNKTQQGVSVFKDIEDVRKLIPNGVETKVITIQSTELGWEQVLFVGKKVQQ